MPHDLPNNPHDLCTWRSLPACAGCATAGALNCRFSWRALSIFLVSWLPFAAAGIAGMVRGGRGAAVIVWGVYWLFFFNVWETRVLCRHCPYYAERGSILHCIANYGCLKIWRYTPRPMSRWEQAQFFAGALILVGFPFPFLLTGRQYAWALAALAGALGFALNLRRTVCTRCVNFSCPANRVPKPVVDAYLRLNPTMREAWEAAGYHLSDTGGRQ